MSTKLERLVEKNRETLRQYREVVKNNQITSRNVARNLSNNIKKVSRGN